MESHFASSLAHQTKMETATQSENDRDRDRGHQMRPFVSSVDCNLNSLCKHIQTEGFNSGVFSDVAVEAKGSTYHLHRLILSRSSYFRNMLHGPWKEAGSPIVKLHIDDKNVNDEALAMALAYMYGHHPALTDDNAFRILATASFLDLQDLCTICTDFIISELWTSNFLAYQVFAESQDYGIHGERVRNACWGYLCQSGAVELKEVISKLSSQTLHALLTSDELWVPSEEKRFQLALYAFLAKGSFSSAEIGVPESKVQMHQVLYPDSTFQAMRSCFNEQASPTSSSLLEMNETKSPGPYVEAPSYGGTNGNSVDIHKGVSCIPSMNSWFSNDQTSPRSSIGSTSDRVLLNDWGRCSGQPLSWGGRVVGRRPVKPYGKNDCGLHREDLDTFASVFEGGSLLYCNMSFEALLNARKQLEEIGFPGKAVNDGLWLQMLLSQRVQEICSDTCKVCCFTSLECTCRQPFVYSLGTNYYIQENEAFGNGGSVFVAESSQVVRPVRVHVRGQGDGLAGIGRGTAFVPTTAWAPTRFVFSRVPFGMGNRNCQQNGNDDAENRPDNNGDVAADGLTALVGLSQGGNNEQPAEAEAEAEGVYEASGGITVQMLESPECPVGVDWESGESPLISLDMNTPLSHFPPFRFGVEFGDVHRLGDGQVKHSTEYFYAGSLWKVSVQAFNDEDPQGRRTLGLFLHRRKAELTESLKKVHMYVDSREKVKARYQLICPSKREVMVFGSFKQRGTLLPKAPKGWGWRTALLFEELPELLQNGTLRVAAVVQLV